MQRTTSIEETEPLIIKPDLSPERLKAIDAAFERTLEAIGEAKKTVELGVGIAVLLTYLVRHIERLHANVQLAPKGWENPRIALADLKDHLFYVESQLAQVREIATELGRETEPFNRSLDALRGIYTEVDAILKARIP